MVVVALMLAVPSRVGLFLAVARLSVVAAFVGNLQ